MSYLVRCSGVEKSNWERKNYKSESELINFYVNQEMLLMFLSDTLY